MSSSFVLRASINLTATAVSDTQVDLTWDDNSANEDGFKIERSSNGTDFTTITTVAQDATSYHDTTVSPGTYYYRVKAYNTAGDSGYSNVASVTIRAWGTATLIENNSGDAYSPQIAMDSSGNAIAVWCQFDGTNNVYDIYANRFE